MLILLPSDSNKLLLSWKGPFEIIEVINEYDYRVTLRNGVKKVFHSNLLKKYEEREEVVTVSVIPCEKIGEEEPLVYVLEVRDTESFEDVSNNPELSTEQKLELKKLHKEYGVTFSDKP